MPEELRPREKALQEGIGSLSDQELLAVILRCGTKKKNALQCADILLQESKGITGLPELPYAKLLDMPAVSKVKALELQACFELARRMQDIKVEQ